MNHQQAGKDSSRLTEALQAVMAQRDYPNRSPHEVFGATDDETWYLLNTEGYRKDEGLRKILPSLPDDAVQSRIIGSSGDRALREGFEAYKLFKQLYEKHAGRMQPDFRLLDFGCGWGRITRFFLKDVPCGQVTGCDCNAYLVDVCKGTNPWCDFIATPVDPPTLLPSASINLIYLYSVFSHLSEDAQDAWRAEFHRLLKPGGLLIATTWDRAFIARCETIRRDPKAPCDPSWRETLKDLFVDTTQHLADYDAGRFVFAPYNRERCPWSYAGDKPRYGEACVPKQYAENRWTDRFDLVDFVDDRALCPQNVIVARKRTS